MITVQYEHLEIEDDHISGPRLQYPIAGGTVWVAMWVVRAGENALVASGEGDHNGRVRVATAVCVLNRNKIRS